MDAQEQQEPRRTMDEVTGAPDIIAILKNPDMHVVPYRQRYERLAERLNLNFDTIIFALDSMPLCLNGAAHQKQRRTVAELITQNTGATQKALPALTTTYFSALERPGMHDILTDTINPCVNELLSFFVGIPLDHGTDSYISRVFSQNIGISKRLKMEAQLGELLASLKTAFPEASQEELGARVALTILGRDSLIGTISASLHAYFTGNPGCRLKDIAFDTVPPKTGVPYIDRVSPENETRRVKLESLESCPHAADRNVFFGAGAHTCLGRPLSLQLWCAITAYLSELETRPAVRSYALRKDDVFNLPEFFTVEVP